MNARAKHRPATLRACRRPYSALAGLLLLCASGCMDPELQSYYGQHEAPALPASVNGTDVLAGMFSEAGHKVQFRRTLVTSEMESADAIVWFPNDYRAPSDEVCQWFDAWLAAEPARTLVFVGRYFDAAPLYWEAMKGRVGKDQQRAYRLREAEAKLSAQPPPNIPADELACPWFHYEADTTSEVTTLAGPWAPGVEAAKTEIQLGTRITSDRPGGRLLVTGDKPLVEQFARSDWTGSRILFVANGSFLLNLPLVNHQNRKLAAKLIAATGDSPRVVFLESGPDGPPIDPAGIDNSLWTLFGAWPLGAILLQLAVAGVIFCFARWPIFGRPKQPPVESTSDFGLHVAAVGGLLARTKDRQFAAQRVALGDGAGAVASQPVRHDRRAGQHPEGQSLPRESKGT